MYVCMLERENTEYQVEKFTCCSFDKTPKHLQNNCENNPTNIKSNYLLRTFCSKHFQAILKLISNQSQTILKLFSSYYRIIFQTFQP